MYITTVVANVVKHYVPSYMSEWPLYLAGDQISSMNVKKVLTAFQIRLQ